ncbi:anti-sigma factor family protein [Streptomyces sp. NPDC058891]|uniref:anti-sigma factor family protein n=1 Tax=Streptomyces sp. NPDC058891 TaxID=3346667 RepID=UPI0036845943
MSQDHDSLRLALGGYVLGALPPAEMEQVSAHLAECDECRAEHAQMAGLRALLSMVTESEVTGETVPAADGDLADRLVARAVEGAEAAPAVRSDSAATPHISEGGLLDKLLRQAAARRRKTWRLQLAGAAASLLFLAAALGGTWLAAIGSVSSEATPPGPTVPAPLRTFTGHDPTTGVSATVKVSPSAWGSTLQVSAKGAPAGITCRLKVVGTGGATAEAATWRAGSYPSTATIPGSAPMAPDAIGHFEIVAGNGQKLVTMQA